MMTEEQALELGKRAVAAGFRIMAGMLAISGERAGTVLHGRARWCPQHDDAGSVWDKLRDDDIPDFRDPATLGILRQQVVALKPGAVAVGMQILQFGERNARVYWVSIAGDYGVPSWCPKQTLGLKCSPDIWPIEALVACLEAAKECNR